VVSLETAGERKERINAARRESAEISRQLGFDVISALSRPVAREAWRKFNEALSVTHVPCEDNPDKWTGEPVTEGRAKMLCANCPLIDLCDDYATKAKETWGVWGGKPRFKVFEEEE